MPCLTSTDVFDLTRAMPEGVHIELGSIPDAVPTARTWARMVWSCWGLSQLADDASVVLSELITNAVAHATGEVVDVWTRTDGHRLAVAVGDACRDMPVRAEAVSTDELGGRGLVLVNALAAYWGSYRVPLGKVVWAVLGPYVGAPGVCAFCGQCGPLKPHHGGDMVCADDAACLARGWRGANGTPEPA